jgi:hypothetical protein
VCAGITTNYDRLVEVAAQNLGEPDFQAIVDVEDIARNSTHRPLLKVHGCCSIGKSRLATVWYREQLHDGAAIQARAERFHAWMQTALLNRDVLIIGFWTDWSHLTDIFTESIAATGPGHVFLVDLAQEHTLREKSPAMWEWAHADGLTFYHIQESGADFLNGLREHFSRVFLRHVFADAADTHEALFDAFPSDQRAYLDGSDAHTLYALRRDITGESRIRPVRVRDAHPSLRVNASIHLRLMDNGATYEQNCYTFDGHVVRLINGAGQVMSKVRNQFDAEPPLPISPTWVVCVGATPDPSPANVVRPAEQPGIMRSGVAGSWTTEEDLINVLRVNNV